MGTALLFTMGKFLLGVYLAKQATASPYGAASAFVIILLYTQNKLAGNGGIICPQPQSLP